MAKTRLSGDDALKIGTTGLPEALRIQVMASYRARGGTMRQPSVSALREALQQVRRWCEDTSRLSWADELTRREDLLELGSS